MFLFIIEVVRGFGNIEVASSLSTEMYVYVCVARIACAADQPANRGAGRSRGRAAGRPRGRSRGRSGAAAMLVEVVVLLLPVEVVVVLLLVDIVVVQAMRLPS